LTYYAFDVYYMLTICETPTFSTQWPDYWSPEEFGEFCAWLAVHPDAGAVIPQSNGCRKVRWSVPGRGKRGGARVIYFNRLEEGHIWLLVMYAKNVRSSIDGRTLAKIRETIDAKDD
jgi:hypothetical protein